MLSCEQRASIRMIGSLFHQTHSEAWNYHTIIVPGAFSPNARDSDDCVIGLSSGQGASPLVTFSCSFCHQAKG